MRRVIGIDTHRTFGEVVIWEDGRLRHVGRVDMTCTALEGFGRKLEGSDEVIIEATGNCMAVSRVLTPFVKRVVIANPLQVKAIAYAHIKTDKIDAGVLASLHAAGFLPEVWLPDGETERRQEQVEGFHGGAIVTERSGATKTGGPRGIRTHNSRLKRPILYR